MIEQSVFGTMTENLYKTNISSKLAYNNVQLYDKVQELTNYTNSRINNLALKASVDPSSLIAVQ